MKCAEAGALRLHREGVGGSPQSSQCPPGCIHQPLLTRAHPLTPHSLLTWAHPLTPHSLLTRAHPLTPHSMLTRMHPADAGCQSPHVWQ